ncbi:hypothetical protein JCM10207_001032 [Rhodosporidiobolus poonsookiae]
MPKEEKRRGGRPQLGMLPPSLDEQLCSASVNCKPILNPPHELVELSLAPLRRDDDRDGRTQRTVPRGKKRDSPVDVPFFPDEDEDDSDDDDDLPLVSIGPTSPNGEWMRLNLSYSLNSHLVETCNHFASDLGFGGFELPDFIRLFQSKGGRTAELSPEETLLSSICMFFGAQFTNHSGVLGSRNIAPSFEQVRSTSELLSRDTALVGSRRYAPLREISRLTRERIEAIDHGEGDVTTRMHRIALAWAALEPLHGDYAIRGDSALRPPRTTFKPYQLERVLGSPTIPLLCSLPESTFDSFMFQHPPIRPTTPQEDVGRLYDSCDLQLYHVNHVLCFTAASNLADAVRYSFNLGAFAQFGLFGISASWACHVALLRIHATEEILAASELHLKKQLTAAVELAYHVLNRFPTYLIACYNVTMRTVTVLEPLSVPLLRDWAHENFEGRKQ